MKPSKLHLYMTGFGPFLTIRENPSSAIGEVVAGQMAQDTELETEYEELGVNLDSTSSYFDRLEENVARCMAENPDGRVLLVHLGVHSGEMAGRMFIEVRGYNELEGSPIDKSLSMMSYKESAWMQDKTSTAMAITDLVDVLNAAASSTENGGTNAQWIISHDAGRYYCNYALYRSLKIQDTWNGSVFAVFLHVANPSYSTNPDLAEQTRQVHSLISGLVRIVKNT